MSDPLTDRLMAIAQEHPHTTQSPVSTVQVGRQPKHDWRVTGVGCSAYCFVDHDITRSRARVKKYGVAAADLNKLIENTGGLCMICRACHASIVEHCHATGHVRGIVCLYCNNRVAHIEPSRLSGALDESWNNCACDSGQLYPEGLLQNRTYAYLDHAMDFNHLNRREAFAALACEPYPDF